MSEVIRFKQLVQPVFTGLTGTVNFAESKIYGVSLITSDIEATGHGLYVDDICLHQLHEFGREMGQVPVTQNHEGGVEDVNGWVENIRLDGKQLRGDWCLLKSHPDTVTMLERAHRQPKTFGLSLAFKGNPEGLPGPQSAPSQRTQSMPAPFKEAVKFVSPAFVPGVPADRHDFLYASTSSGA